MDNVEEHLLTISKIPASSGHSLHKGTPREAFIKKFLQQHLSERVAIGTGEIIDANSKPGESRNQIDIVVYRRDYPRLDFEGGINAFLAESVVATIEVKSTLDEEGLRKCILAARNTKKLSRNIVTSFSAGYQPPSILSYLVAYDGPAQMKTIYDWNKRISAAEGVSYPTLPPDDTTRCGIASPALDAVFVLGRGFMHYGNTPFGFLSAVQLRELPSAKWAVADLTKGNLLLLFLFLTSAISGISGSWLDPRPYISGFKIGGVGWGD
jgi:hypothetical protein